MYRKTPLIAGEIFHVYNRGANKQNIFTCDWDYKRFSLLMHLANNSEPIHLSNLLTNKKYQGESLLKIFEESLADKSLVDIFAYCLMPNHFHLVIRPKVENGLSLFMKKLMTGYSMYFNTKYDHSGVLFQGPFKSIHVRKEAYFRYIFAYVHLNSLDIFQANWKENGIKREGNAKIFMEKYPHSSFFDYCVGNRPERAILSFDTAPDFLKTENDFENLLKWYAEEKPQQGLSLLE